MASAATSVPEAAPPTLEEVKKLEISFQAAEKLVCVLKEKGAPEAEQKSAADALKKLQLELKAKTKLLARTNKVDTDVKARLLERERIENMLRRRFFFNPSFEIYGGVAGLHDYGPCGCAVQTNLLSLWRNHFILTDNLLEIDCPALTPEVVLAASGHVAKFADFLVKDQTTGTCYRADHLLEGAMEKLMETATDETRDEYAKVKAQADAFNKDELAAALTKYNVRAPDTGNELTAPYPFNLMFGTSIGPSGNMPGFLRPETAQGIFVNFRRLLEYNGGKIPFGVAQIGKSFRNEIAPRAGLLRVREFLMCEVEYFVKGNEKDHPRFSSVADLVMQLYPQDNQLGDGKTVKMTIGEAVAKGIVNNQTLGYFLARTMLFMTKAGIDFERLRFRQHLKSEMAHYACDCWDAETSTTYGWVECVGIADRSAFDLTVHSKASGTPLVYFEEFKPPRVVPWMRPNINKSALGQSFKKAAAGITEFLMALDDAAATSLQDELSANGKASVTVKGEQFELTPAMISFVADKKTVNGQNITPNVIEPSFGIGRILYSIFEHCFYIRDGDANRTVLRLPPAIAPVKVSLLPLMQKPALLAAVPAISELLLDAGLSCKLDETGAAIGRRYARTDEIGIPFAITIDFVTLEDQTVTLRERDTMGQIRLPYKEIPDVLTRLIRGAIQWSDCLAKYPAVQQAEDAEETKA